MHCERSLKFWNYEFGKLTHNIFVKVFSDVNVTREHTPPVLLCPYGGRAEQICGFHARFKAEKNHFAYSPDSLISVSFWKKNPCNATQIKISTPRACMHIWVNCNVSAYHTPRYCFMVELAEWMTQSFDVWGWLFYVRLFEKFGVGQ